MISEESINADMLLLYYYGNSTAFEGDKVNLLV